MAEYFLSCGNKRLTHRRPESQEAVTELRYHIQLKENEAFYLREEGGQERSWLLCVHIQICLLFPLFCLHTNLVGVNPFSVL